MNSHDVSPGPGTSEALRTYLPELTDPVLIAHVEERLRAAAGARTAAEPQPRPEQPVPYDPSLDPDGLFHDYFRHFVGPWTDLVRDAAAQSPLVADPGAVVDDFLVHQTGLVSRLMIRTLVEELHQRRSAGLLDGGSPEERYAAFRRWTNSASGHGELLGRYPHLFHLVHSQVGSAARYVVELLRELDSAAPRLGTLIPGGAGDARVERLVLGEGDTHNGGRSVAQVLFTDGRRVLYKPHPIGAEAGYSSFVSWMNGRLGTDLPTVAVLPTEHGGFVEFIPTEEYAGEEKDYFARIGTLAGILFLLRATDIHFENMVSCAAGPVVIDTETLLSPRLNLPEAYDDGAASKIAALTLRESIIGSGLLPLVVRAGDDDHGMDIGAIGYDTGQRSPYKSLSLQNPGRDDMFVGMVTTTTTAANANLAVQRATQLPVNDQRDIIKREFSRVLRYAAQQPDAVVHAIEEFLGDVQFRHVNQATIFYTQLLRMATHPHAMADPVVRAAVLNRTVLRTGDSPEIADAEVRQMARGDVPYFSYTARSRALGSTDGTVRADALAEPPLTTVRERVHGLDEAVIERELRLIDFSFVNKLPTEQEETGFVPVRPAGRPPVAVDRDRFVHEAVRVGERLLATRVASTEPRHPATWIAPQVTTDSQSQWSPGTLGYDLYGGSPGPALVLAALARETGRADFAAAARGVLDPVEEQLRGGALAEQGVSVGGMTGMAGTAYALVVARDLLDEPEAGRLGELARELARCSGAEIGTDFLSGMAGALSVGLALHERATDPAERAVVAEAVRTIAARETEALGGFGLQDPRVTPYTGYAHGAMGIAPVLLRYGAEFDDPDVHGLGLRILGAVLESQAESDRDWPRVWGEPERSYGWCHGAPGILLGALMSNQHAPGAVSRPVLDRLAELTLARGFGNNPTYCHGDLAGAEIVRLGEDLVPGLFGEGAGGGGAEDLYPRLFDEVVERYGQRSDTKYAYTNSLMVGEAGLAWSVLHHLDPGSHPSLLRLA
ncbi:type 2 lanthipeptide synthetase LanM family protein [Streptomyces sp. C11-1]|uniref:Type 2 lanthipeptide synthetase LanM family protein n=1 Tax=Streptomyces durocortorensis TaxID=2811104 RepID=A0ABY9VVU3_9ACTN|nr:type 2 lanthipeptide synthetase LanM family protein [Streptomyces durocortorensis]WNF28047.1 type 2 lanthipeptide synthetase LanM family protein [Streptomyces durocortorensis]